jgi:hypothetical protein
MSGTHAIHGGNASNAGGAPTVGTPLMRMVNDLAMPCPRAPTDRHGHAQYHDETHYVA